MLKIKLVTSVWLLLVYCSNVNSAGFFTYSAEVSSALDDNVTNGARASDIREDVFYELGGSASYNQELNDSHAFIYSISARLRSYSEFDLLNSTTLSGSFKYKFALSRGFTSPIYSVGLSLSEQSTDSLIRESSIVGLTAQAFTQLTDKLSLIAGLGHTQRESEGNVFDQTRTRLFASTDLLISDRWIGYLTYVYSVGDVASTAEANNIYIVSIADAIEADDAFGGISTGQFAYRIKAKTHLLTFGANYTIKHGQSIDLSARILSTKADENSGVSYGDVLLRASYLVSFK